MPCFRCDDHISGLGLDQTEAKSSRELVIRYLEREEVMVLLLLAESYGLKTPRSAPTMATFVVLTSGLAGYHPKKHHALLGVKKLREVL